MSVRSRPISSNRFQPYRLTHPHLWNQLQHGNRNKHFYPQRFVNFHPYQYAQPFSCFVPHVSLYPVQSLPLIPQIVWDWEQRIVPARLATPLSVSVHDRDVSRSQSISPCVPALQIAPKPDVDDTIVDVVTCSGPPNPPAIEATADKENDVRNVCAQQAPKSRKRPKRSAKRSSLDLVVSRLKTKSTLPTQSPVLPRVPEFLLSFLKSISVNEAEIAAQTVMNPRSDFLLDKALD